jgi:hypothetical protein
MPGQHGQSRTGRHPAMLGEDGAAVTVARASGGEAGDVAKQAAADAVTGRSTRPEEVADLIMLVASGRAGNVTGSDFVIDGGLITTLWTQQLTTPRPSRGPDFCRELVGVSATKGSTGGTKKVN